MKTMDRESDLVQYSYDSRRRSLVVIYGLAGLISGLLWGLPTIGFWRGSLFGHLDWSLSKCALLHGALLASLWFLFLGCVECPDVIAQESGVMVTTCYFFRFFVPWKDIVHIKALSRLPFEPSTERDVQQHVVSIQRGLTVFHRGLPLKDGKEKQRLRGFVLRSDAHGYHDLVRVIEEHVDARKE